LCIREHCLESKKTKNKKQKISQKPSIDQQKRFANHVFVKGLISEYIKNSYNSTKTNPKKSKQPNLRLIQLNISLNKNHNGQKHMKR
jgi:hypothetical protein